MAKKTMHSEELVAAADVGAPYVIGSGWDAFERIAGEKLRPEFQADGMEFDPTVILLLIQALLPLLQDCFKKNRNVTPQSLRDRNNITAVALAVRKVVNVRMVAAFRWARTIHGAADAASDQECKAFIDDCRCCA